VRCPSCGERVSRGDEVCWSCGALLRYEEPRGTLQQEMEGRYQPNEWIAKNGRVILAIGVALGLIVAALGAIYLIQEITRSSSSGNLRITDYTYGNVDEGVWFAIYVKNDGSWRDSRTVIAEVSTPSGIYTNNTEVEADPGTTVAKYIFIQLPPGENQGNYQTDCYLSLF
jgi:hypothetical protein